MADKAIKVYNNIPKDSVLLEGFKPLGKEDRKAFRLVGIYDSHTKKKTLRTEILPSEETVMDPNTGDFYDIACIKSQSANGNYEFIDIVFDDMNNGELILSGSSNDDQKRWRQIYLSNHNGSNLRRDESKRIIFEEIELDADAKTERQRRRRGQAALEMVDMMSDLDIRAFFMAKGMPVDGSDERNRNTLEALAQEKPELIEKYPTVGLSQMIDKVEKFKKVKIIQYDKSTREWLKHDGKVVLAMKKVFGVDPTAELAKFFFKESAVLNSLEADYTELTGKKTVKEEDEVKEPSETTTKKKK